MLVYCTISTRFPRASVLSMAGYRSCTSMKQPPLAALVSVIQLFRISLLYEYHVFLVSEVHNWHHRVVGLAPLHAELNSTNQIRLGCYTQKLYKIATILLFLSQFFNECLYKVFIWAQYDSLFQISYYYLNFFGGSTDDNVDRSHFENHLFFISLKAWNVKWISKRWSKLLYFQFIVNFVY